MKGFIRPEATVLDENALVPPKNLISPAPNQFTHELTKEQPYYYGEAQPGTPPDGTLPVGAKVVLLGSDGGTRCRVVDGQGLYVETECQGLRRL